MIILKWVVEKKTTRNVQKFLEKITLRWEEVLHLKYHIFLVEYFVAVQTFYSFV